MNIAIIGSGGREHALCFKLSESKKVKKIFCFPGNAGTENIAKNININLSDFEELKKIIFKNKIEMVIVGPEKPLVEGVVDYLEENNILVFGPNKIAAQLEGSKTFTKELCKKYNIPTAEFEIFYKSKDAKKFLKTSKYPVVIKADGLAAGKGVYICENELSGQNAIEEIFGGKFGKPEKLLIEEFLQGEEMSFFIISDGKSFKIFETAQDHKRVGEGDVGKNTGGMGAYSPSLLINPNLQKKIINKIIQPTLKSLNKIGCSYKGFLYAGLMIIKNEPYLIEYNVRMGDPECQTIIPRLKTDLFEIILSCCKGYLKNLNLKWDPRYSLSIVLCSKGYPDKYEKNIRIEGLENLVYSKNQFIFHAGTSKINNEILATGGRVLNFTTLSESFYLCQKKSIELINNLNWNNGFYRKDIGYKVIK